MFKRDVKTHTIVVTDGYNVPIVLDVERLVMFSTSNAPYNVSWANRSVPSRYLVFTFMSDTGTWVYTKAMIEKKYPGLCIFDPKMDYKD